MTEVRTVFDPAQYRSPFDGDSRLVVKDVGNGLQFVGLRGGVALVMPPPDPRWSPRQRGAYLARRDASLTLTCPSCGNVALVVLREATLLHEADCVIGDEHFPRTMAG